MRSVGLLHVRDPLEGRSGTGTIVTGAASKRIDQTWRPVLDAASRAVLTVPSATLYVYGSVATGQAVIGRSDVDLLTVGLPAERAADIADELSGRFAELTRGVEIGTALPHDLMGDHDEAFGNRVFLRHYCVHVAGPDHHRPTCDFLADVKSARGFNGDIARHRDRWREHLHDGDDMRALATRIARKTLLAVAGLVSVRDDTWTTDRSSAAIRWAEIAPEHRHGLMVLRGWVDGTADVERPDIRRILDRTVDPLVEQFADLIGLWS